MKQFMEKEQLLKLMLSKYSDQQHAETSAIKANFKVDREKLEAMKDEMPEELYKDAVKKMRLNEENLIRDVDLKI